ncbi:MAG: hypothetical protein AAGA30_04945, partial [Planctomycetota bacterium]
NTNSDLEIDQVQILDGFGNGMKVEGISTSGNDVKLSVGGNVSILEKIETGAGITLISSNGSVTQSMEGHIRSAGLGLMVDGVTLLENTQNAFASLATDNVGDTNITSSTSTTIDHLSVDGMLVDGIRVGNDLELMIEGQLDQTAMIIVNGKTNLIVSESICLVGTDSSIADFAGNDFGDIVTATGRSIEISDRNDLRVGDIQAIRQIRLVSGDGESGSIYINGDLVSSSEFGQTLLETDSEIRQSISTSISTRDLLIIDQLDNENANSTTILNGQNQVERIATGLSGNLEFINRQDLQISPLQFISCRGDTIELTGLSASSVSLTVANDSFSSNHLTDADNAITSISSRADLVVSGDIVLGDGEATLEFIEHGISNLIGRNSSDHFLTISQIGNRGFIDGSDVGQANNVSLFVNSSLIISDTNVSDTLIIATDSTDAETVGDILQTMRTEEINSRITASDAALISAGSVQLNETDFDRLALWANQDFSHLISNFQLNENIGSTFTGSLLADSLADASNTYFQNGVVPVDGVSDVEDSFNAAGFSANNNAFVNQNRVGSVIFNDGDLTMVSLSKIIPSPDAIVNDPRAHSSLSMGDTYIETSDGYDLVIEDNIEVTTGPSNMTLVAGDELVIEDQVSFSRSNSGSLIGLVNTLRDAQSDALFQLDNARSVFAAPGDEAFSDFQAQLDTAIGFQPFDFTIGNAGEQSFNLIIGWFIDSVTAGQAIDATFQASLLNNSNDSTADFMFSNFDNFGQGASGYWIQDPTGSFGFSNISQFEQSFFADRSFMLSQVFATNDPRINLFADAGTTDHNFTQAVLPTRTVVENPDVIVVATPTFIVPATPGAAPEPTQFYVSFIQQPESQTISTEQSPESYFKIKYTADDDGVFEFSFKWADPNDDPDAIRTTIENAVLYEDQEYWSFDENEKNSDWTEKIKQADRVRPGLYFIFEVQEGQELVEPVDAPIDRTDLENLTIPSDSDSTDDVTPEKLGLKVSDASHNNPVVLKSDLEWISDDRLSAPTRKALLGSSLFMVQMLNHSKSNEKSRTATTVENTGNIFSASARWKRRNFTAPNKPR